MTKLSIIMPVYNVEKYVAKSIESVLNQTFQDFELLLIDDGSKDKSGSICDKYAANDKRITVYHKENGGLSSSRNHGIERAKGKYITFIDSDDFISENMYQDMCNSLDETNGDVAIGRFVHCYGEIPTRLKTEQGYVQLKKEEVIKDLVIGNITSSACNKVYRIELFDTIRYPLNKITEDAYIVLDLFHLCNKITYVDSALYYYVHRENSITTKPFSMKDMDTIAAWEKNYHFTLQYYPQLEKEAKTRVCWAHFIVLEKMNKDYKDIRKKIVSYLRSNALFVLFNPYFQKARKLSMLALLINYHLFYYLLNWYRNQNRKLYN